MGPYLLKKKMYARRKRRDCILHREIKAPKEKVKEREEKNKNDLTKIQAPLSIGVG